MSSSSFGRKVCSNVHSYSTNRVPIKDFDLNRNVEIIRMNIINLVNHKKNEKVSIKWWSLDINGGYVMY